MTSFGNFTTRKVIIIAVLVALVALALGIIIGYFSAPRTGGDGQDGSAGNTGSSAKQWKEDETITQKMFEDIKAENIRTYLRNLTAHPHLAGTPADKQQADELKVFFEQADFDRTVLAPYNVLLSYPDKNDPNMVYLLDENDQVVFQSQRFEKILDPEQNQSNVVPPFNAYSPPGRIKGELVYVNYARVEDFIWLEENTNVNVSGKIVIARYGKIFRGDKVNIAQRYGAVGVIMFTDPADYAAEGSHTSFPDSWWMPETGVQRGNIVIHKGDALTPKYPATDSAYRLPENETTLPKIPAHPISYGDARELLRHMRGDKAPDTWQGKMNISYNLGPGFENSNWRVQMNISTHNERRTTYNVISFIKGSVEPDRYVIVGNHRDAWVFGAIDPSSGTASMMELARVVGKQLKAGWRPRRSLLFCSWGAEEYGLVGSMEWIEHYIKNLESRTVAYLNVDGALAGWATLRAKASPLLAPVVFSAAKKVPNPNATEISEGRKTVYDTWAKYDPNPKKPGEPRLLNLGSGSDFATFFQRLGIPCTDHRYTFDSKMWKLSSYPVYHSAYELFSMVDKYMDPGFKHHQAVTQMWAEMTRDLADSLLLPMSANHYAESLQGFVQSLKDGYGELMRNNSLGDGLDFLDSAVNNFTEAAKGFHDRMENIDTKNPHAVRMINDQLMWLERAFIDPSGLPGRPLYKHIIFAPSSHNSYAGDSFPGLVDAMFEIEKDSDQHGRWEKLKQHLATVVFTIQSAASTLLEPTLFS